MPSDFAEDNLTIIAASEVMLVHGSRTPRGDIRHFPGL
jgi:hypothetical protein